MRIRELQNHIASLECAIASHRSCLSQVDAHLAALEEARRCVIAARDEAEALMRTCSYFTPVTWAGVHADAFMDAMSPGGSVQREAASVLTGCEDLLAQMDARIHALGSERDALQSSMRADRHAIEQARVTVRHLLRAR